MMTSAPAANGSRSRPFKRLVFPAPRKPVTIVSGNGGGGFLRWGASLSSPIGDTQPWARAHCLACFSGFLLFVFSACIAAFAGGCCLPASFLCLSNFVLAAILAGAVCRAVFTALCEPYLLSRVAAVLLCLPPWCASARFA